MRGKIRAWDGKEFLPLAREVAFIDDYGNLRSRIEGITFDYYTDWKDMHGQEIAVGDILQDIFGQRVEVVEFIDVQNAVSGFTLRSVKKPDILTYGYEVFAYNWLTHAEIIGNIRENPELTSFQSKNDAR